MCSIHHQSKKSREQINTIYEYFYCWHLVVVTSTNESRVCTEHPKVITNRTSAMLKGLRSSEPQLPKAARCIDLDQNISLLLPSCYSSIPPLPWLPPRITDSIRITGTPLPAPQPNPLWAPHPFTNQFAAQWILRCLIIGYFVGSYKFIFKINELEKNESSSSAGIQVRRGTERVHTDNLCGCPGDNPPLTSLLNWPPLLDYQYHHLDFNHKCNGSIQQCQ